MPTAFATLEHPVTQLHTLPTGLRVLFRRVPSTALVHCAVVLNVGSRDEQPGEMGLAHLMEHMLFKGTTRRKAFHVLQRLDAVGGDLNAYTDKEKTVLHASVAAEHLERALELLADIAFEASFPAHELRKEKQVVAEEIDMLIDQPDEVAWEAFDTHLYPEHPLGWPIQGTQESVAAFQPEHLLAFRARYYRNHRIALAVAGNVAEVRLLRLAEHYFTRPGENGAAYERASPPAIVAGELALTGAQQQTHVIWGGPAPTRGAKDYTPFVVLNHYLGGPSWTSLLSLRIRERHGLAYNLYSDFRPYTDCGSWGIYGATDPGRSNRLVKLVQKELDALCQHPLTPRKLDALKQQFIGHLKLQSEGAFSTVLGQAKDMLDLGHMYELPEAIAAISALSAEDLLGVAQAYFAPERLSLVRYLPGS